VKEREEENGKEGRAGRKEERRAEWNCKREEVKC
jgi:hypothetical protein